MMSVTFSSFQLNLRTVCYFDTSLDSLSCVNACMYLHSVKRKCGLGRQKARRFIFDWFLCTNSHIFTWTRRKRAKLCSSEAKDPKKVQSFE